MSDVTQEYEAKRISYDDLLAQFAPGTRLQLGVWYGEPYGIIKALNAFEDGPDPLYVHSNIHTAPAEYLNHPNVFSFTNFYGVQERTAHKAHNNVYYTPLHFCDFQRFIRNYEPVDYFCYRAAPMNEHGKFNCSLTASYEYYAIKWIANNHPETKIVLEVNPNLPMVKGLEAFGNNELDLSDVDYIVEDDSPLFCFPDVEPTVIEQRIAEHVAALIDDGATIQLGFGGVPMAVGRLLTKKRGLGIHSEMFCDAHIDLVEAGAVTNANKGVHDGVSVATFALGGPRLQSWVAENDAFAMLPVEEVNRVPVLAGVNKMTGVNALLTIDLSGQATAHCLANTTYSGIGGAFEFAYGCQLSPGGKSIACLPSTATLKDGRVVSNIVLTHPPGTRITMPEHVTDWVVTEHGAAWLKYLNLEQRAEALINIAHPDFRDDLRRQALETGIRLSALDRLPKAPSRYFVPATP